MRFLILGGAVLLLAGGAQAFVSCRGDDGRIRFANSAAECAGAVIGNYTPKKPKKAKSAKRASGKTGPGKFGKISPQKQRELDKTRGDVLLYELKSEKNMKELLEKLIGETPDGEARRREVLQKRRKEHALNITAIRQELARLGIYAGHSGD